MHKFATENISKNPLKSNFDKIFMRPMLYVITYVGIFFLSRKKIIPDRAEPGKKLTLKVGPRGQYPSGYGGFSYRALP